MQALIAYPWEAIVPSEIALAVLLVACVCASLARVARVASGQTLPARFTAAMETLALTPASDHRRRANAVRAALRATLGVGALLPILAKVSVAWGGVLFIESWIYNRYCSCGGCDYSRQALLAMIFRDGLRHTAIAFSLAFLGTVAHAWLLALARRTTKARLGPAFVETASLSLADDASSMSTTYWSVASFVGPFFLMMAAMFSAAEFYPTYAMDVSTGPCAPTAVMIHVVDDRHVVRLDAGDRVQASASVDRVSSIVTSGDLDIELRVGDGVTHGALVSIVDALRRDALRTVCVPVADDSQARSTVHAP